MEELSTHAACEDTCGFFETFQYFKIYIKNIFQNKGSICTQELKHQSLHSQIPRVKKVHGKGDTLEIAKFWTLNWLNCDPLPPLLQIY
jgi:hypothetical protein